MRRNEGQGHSALDGVQANVIVGPGRGKSKKMGNQTVWSFGDDFLIAVVIGEPAQSISPAGMCAGGIAVFRYAHKACVYRGR